VGYTQKVVIAGAGISGLACAYRLKQLGVPSLVLEAEGRPGGVIATVRRDGYLFETGPQCPRFPASVWQMLREIGLEEEFVAGDPAVKRFILRHGTLHPAPFSPGGILTTPLIGISAKLRFLTEPLRSTQPPAHEETLAEFATRKFGADVVDNLADPVISTIFFGDAYKMGMDSAFPALVEWEKNHGSLVRGAIRARNSKRQAPSQSMKVTDSLPSLGSFRSGMGRLPERLAEELRGHIRYGVRVQGVAPNAKGNAESATRWQIGLSNGESITAEQMVLSLPAYEAGRVLESSMPALARELEAIEYAPMGGVSCGYDRNQVKDTLDGFGLMVPRKEELKTICTFWNSSLFPGRAPDGKVLMTSFVRSVGEAVDEGALARTVETENASILGIAGEPVARHAWSYPRALPQYNVGHGKRVAAIGDLLPALRNLYLAGNYLKGRSIGECVELAFEVAERIHSQIAESNIEPVTTSSEE